MPEFFLDMVVHILRLMWENRAGREALLVLVPLTFLIGFIEFALDLRRDRSPAQVVAVATMFVLLVASSLFSFHHFPA